MVPEHWEIIQKHSRTLHCNEGVLWVYFSFTYQIGPKYGNVFGWFISAPVPIEYLNYAIVIWKTVRHDDLVPRPDSGHPNMHCAPLLFFFSIILCAFTVLLWNFVFYLGKLNLNLNLNLNLKKERKRERKKKRKTKDRKKERKKTYIHLSIMKILFILYIHSVWAAINAQNWFCTEIE